MTDGEILVRVVPLARGREIGWGADVAESLEKRLGDIRRAMAAGTRAVAAGVPDMETPQGWSLSQVEAKFGVTLAAEGSVIVSKASAEASFEVTITYRRD